MLHISHMLVFADASPPVPWWQVATGIIGVPAAILGLVLTWILVQKTRLEAQKTKLEIREKERALSLETPQEEGTASTRRLAGPLLEGQLVQNLILRLIVVFMVFTLWNLVRRFFDVIYSTTRLGLGTAIPDPDPSPWIWTLWAGLQAIKAIPEIGYWLILVGLGWPLLLDALGLLNIETPAWLRSVALQRSLTAIAVLLPLALMFPGLQ